MAFTSEYLTTTTVATHLTTVWARDIYEASYGFVVMKPLIMHYGPEDVYQLQASQGLIGANTVYVPKIGTMTAQTYTAGTALTWSYNTESYFSLTGTNYYVGIIIPEDLPFKLHPMSLPAHRKMMAQALAAKYDAVALALYSGLTTNTVGSSTDNFSEDLVLAAHGKLIVQNAPLPYSCVIDGGQVNHLFKIKDFTRADARGPINLPINEGVQANGYLGNWYGINFFASNNVTSSTGHHNMMFSRDAFAGADWALPYFKQGTFEDYAFDTVRCHVQFGIGEANDAYACEIVTV